MAHRQQNEYCESIKNRFPNKFKGANGKKLKVLDVGSLDINGNNRFLFENYEYTGIDIGPGKNVDIVSKGHEFNPGKQYDLVISTECFEHDKFWDLTIKNCIKLTKPGGLFLFTCATTGRNEHGTSRTTPNDSPYSHIQFDEYYKNLTALDILGIPGFVESFSEFGFSTNMITKDLYFYGIKNI